MPSKAISGDTIEGGTGVGFLDFVTTSVKLLRRNFVPDFTLPEYDNWLNFLNAGGTTEEWEKKKKEKGWSFPEDENEKFIEYQEELHPLFDQYLKLVKEIEKTWSILYNSKEYYGETALIVEKKCLEAILYYKKARNIDLKYGQSAMSGSLAFTKLALLYERQRKYEEAIMVCKEALSLEIDESSRLFRMIKKANRTPTKEEKELVERIAGNNFIKLS